MFMRFVDDLFALYKDKLTGNENEAIVLVLNILAEQGRDDLMKLIREMSSNELRQMLSLYMVELLKLRMVKEGIMEPGHEGEHSRYH